MNKWKLVNEIFLRIPLDFNVEMFIYGYESRIVYAKLRISADFIRLICILSVVYTLTFQNKH